MSVCAVSTCDRPAQAVICRSCTGRLVAELREIATGGIQRKRVHVLAGEQLTLVDYRPGLAADLDATLARLAAGAGLGERRRSHEPELPYHAGAAELAHELRNTITTWARVLLDKHPKLTGPRGTSTAAVAGWLSMHPVKLAMLPAADELYAEIHRLCRRIRGMIDPGTGRPVYLGPCGAETDTGTCATDLYGRLDRTATVCQGCCTVWAVAGRQEWLQGQAEDQLATAAEITRAMPVLLGGRVAGSTIRWWASVGKLRRHPPHPHDTHRRPRFRVGDVIDLAMAQAASATA